MAFMSSKATWNPLDLSFMDVPRRSPGGSPSGQKSMYRSSLEAPMAKNHHITSMVQQMGIFHAVRFSFDPESAYFQRNKGRPTLVREWNDMWYGCSTGQCDGNELDILWCAWMIPDGP